MEKAWTGLLGLLVLVSSVRVGSASPDDRQHGPSASDDAPRRFLTRHRLETDRGTIAYTAAAAETIVSDDAGEPLASIFTIAYTKDEVSDNSTRPITFAFNGGPGSSAVWLHLGLLGPRRLEFPNDPGPVGAAPYDLAPNPLSLLEVSDLVLVDPIGAGYSRALGGAEDSEYWGTDEDAAIVAAFIRRYLSEHRRWNSPKYLLGESYGTIRACLLARDLQAGLNNVAVSGVILIAPALDSRHIAGANVDMPFITRLPTFAATALYHGCLDDQTQSLSNFLAEVRKFAIEEYSVALLYGDALASDRSDAIVEQLHRYTGLRREYLRDAHLRIDAFRFMRELLRERGQVVGFLDTRFVGTENDAVGEMPSVDPFIPAISSVFVSGINDYLTTELIVDMDRPYIVFNDRAPVEWRRPEPVRALFEGFFNVTPELKRVTANNPDLRIFVASGIYDLTTTAFAAEFVFNHSGIDKQRITMRDYEAGHMMYVHEPSFRQLALDLKCFIEAGNDQAR